MAITIQQKQDVSYLFSSLGTSASNAASSNFLLQYASIKNGSYAKLLKAYYSETSNDAVNSIVKNSKNTSALTSEEAKALTEVQKATDSLKESADALLDSGKNSVFNKDDEDAVYNAVNDFVKDYNAVIDAVNQVDTDSVVNKATNMVNSVLTNVKMLNQVGITINEDSTLSIDKDTFQKADMTKVKNLFNSTGSFGYGMSAKASLINFSAERASSKASTYTINGTYNNTYNTGNIFDSIF